MAFGQFFLRFTTKAAEPSAMALGSSKFKSLRQFKGSITEAYNTLTLKKRDLVNSG